MIKNGIPVAILGAPNVGKSTLLNTLLNEEKAIVSDIAGTTRDAIEDELNIEGFKINQAFRDKYCAYPRDLNYSKQENSFITKFFFNDCVCRLLCQKNVNGGNYV